MMTPLEPSFASVYRCALALAALLAAACEAEAPEGPRCGGQAQACCAGESPCGAGLGCSASLCIAAPFATGSACLAHGECEVGYCAAGVCTAPTCDDGAHNGAEGSVDCGGGCPSRCALGAGCKVDSDCGRGSCVAASAGSVCGFAPGGLLGKGGGSTSVAWTQVAGASDGLKAPTDIAFSPEPGQPLWIVDRQRDAFLIIHDPGSDKAQKRLILDISQHFLEEVLAISFDGHGSFGTCGDSRNSYGGMAPADDFMGPVQWPADLGHYPQGGSAHEQHWDMLHSTPRCMGIAASGDDQFYCVNGLVGSIDWYDFHEPHVPGGDDHADGEKLRYLDPNLKVGRVAGVPSNAVWDAEAQLLYVADSGNGRVLRLDPKGATKGGLMTSFPFDGTLNQMSGFALTALIDGQLTMPSGLALHFGTLYVADRGTGLLLAFDVQGKLLGTLDSGLGPDRLGGMTAGPDDRLYVVDIAGKRVLRVDTSW